MCSLNELYSGTVKRLRFIRNVNGKRVNEEITINVQPGWKEGTKITYENMGDVSPTVVPSDLIITIKQKPHPVYTRDNNDLIIEVSISLHDALYGYNKNITTLDDNKHINKLSIKGDRLPTSNYVQTIKNKGMPIRKNGKIIGCGDIKVKFNVIFPTKT